MEPFYLVLFSIEIANEESRAPALSSLSSRKKHEIIDKSLTGIGAIALFECLHHLVQRGLLHGQVLDLELSLFEG